MIQAIVTDIEGTTTPISFVTEVLYPYAREHLPDLVRQRGRDPAVASSLTEARAAAGAELDDEALIGQLLAWMDADRKVTPLKELQGLIWEQGYHSGALLSPVYPDVADKLRQWHHQGLRLYVYSSGSAHAQRLIFAHTSFGDLTPLFDGFFDTRIGPKRDPRAYQAIAAAIGVPAPAILFLSDVREELDAARQAGLRTTWLTRSALPRLAAAHRQVRDFHAILV